MAPSRIAMTVAAAIACAAAASPSLAGVTARWERLGHGRNLANGFTPSTKEALAPIGIYDGYVLQSFGNQSIGDPAIQKCSNSVPGGATSQLGSLSIEPFAFDFAVRVQAEPLRPGGLLIEQAPRDFTSILGVDLPQSDNILRTTPCFWAEAYPRSDGNGYDILLVELGGSDWGGVSANSFESQNRDVQCNRLTYLQTLAQMQPNWKNVPVCEINANGTLKRWSRIHRYSPRTAGGAVLGQPFGPVQLQAGQAAQPAPALAAPAPAPAPAFTPSAQEALAPISVYDGYVFQSFGNTSDRSGIQLCGGRTLRQLSTLSIEPYAFDFSERPQVDPSDATGGLTIPENPRDFTSILGVDLPQSDNVLRTTPCFWAEATPRADGRGFDILLVELGGTEWGGNTFESQNRDVQCNRLSYLGNLASQQPDWKNTPYCLSDNKGGIARYSRIHKYSPRAVGGAQ